MTDLDLTKVIKSVTDLWDEPLDDVHDLPQIVNAILAAGYSRTVGTGAGGRATVQDTDTAWVTRSTDCPEAPAQAHCAGLNLTKLREIAEAATEGGWHWAGNTDTGEPYLATWIRGIGRCNILSIGSEDRSTTGRKADGVRADAREFDLGDPEELVDQWAHDQFGEPVKDPRLQFTTDLMCVSARDLVVYEVAPLATTREDDRVYRADISDIRHPDAAHIATFDPPTVLALIDEVERLQSDLTNQPLRDRIDI